MGLLLARLFSTPFGNVERSLLYRSGLQADFSYVIVSL